MIIRWHGFSCFELGLKRPQQEDVSLIINPFITTEGKPFIKNLPAQIVVFSGGEIKELRDPQVFSDPFFIDEPGEYEIKEACIDAFLAPRFQNLNSKHLIFRFEIEEIHIAHLGVIDRSLEDKELSYLRNIDILLLPVGGGSVMSPKIAVEVIGQIEPRVVIPMMYATPGREESLLTLEDFCKELGTCRQEQVNEYKVSRKDLPDEDMIVVILSPKS
ncbi:hypothetical protein CO172_02165 [Candidatus Uhrbacteria bacterium CG_4_9_14_3_um_filter_36_7]|uniref:Lactamase n=1 Tax=Candidatus Uhrbacteria bacterium CG_4_9_14_3_um_filter_36_7 TaxID=1975033 RepID=A0A2M7XHH0_9BACT|nr:MAG: hypothetical protein CO172_02165 [Candidatus Uhrbacteria bacterium CG_4_9_14_3_um_filter_36_7]